MDDLRNRRAALWAVPVAAVVALPFAGVASASGPTTTAAEPRTAAAAGDGPGDAVLQPLPRPRDFVAVVDNPFLPFEPGDRWVYKGHGDEKGERNVVEVLHRTKVIEGITATVVHDVVLEDGELVEDTHDWYAQDRTGTVWYLGEKTAEYEDGEVVSREGSWEAGVDGAQAGVVMPAHPVPGQWYRQEYDPGNAVDSAEVVDDDAQVEAPAGHFDGVRVIHEATALEPHAAEQKFYARGVGVVEEISTSPTFSRSVLVRTNRS